MVRPLRIAYPDAFYHVTARGNQRRKIFLSQADYVKFLSHLGDAAHKDCRFSSYRSYILPKEEAIVSKEVILVMTDIGRSIGNMSCSAVTKMTARLKANMGEDKTLREEIDRIEKVLSDVNGRPH